MTIEINRKRILNILVLLFPLIFTGMIFLGELYVSLDEGTYDQPLIVEIDFEGRQINGPVFVEKLAFRSIRENLERKNDSYIWISENGKLRDLWIEGNTDEIKAIAFVHVEIGDRAYTYEADSFGGIFSVGKAENTARLHIGELIPRPYSYLPWRFGSLINVDLASFFLDRLPAILMLLVLSAGIVLFVQRRPPTQTLVNTGFAAVILFLVLLTVLRLPPIYSWTLVFLWIYFLFVSMSVGREDDRELPLTGMHSVELNPRYIVLLILITAAIYLPCLGRKILYVDEVFSYKAAQFILDTGAPEYPETGYYYGRALIFHHIVAASIALFGRSVLAARLPNLLWLAGTAVLLFYLLRRKGFWPAVTGVVLFLLAPATIDLGREVRMYPMFAFWFTLAAVSLFHSFNFQFSENAFRRPRDFVRLFQWRWLLLFFLSFAIAFNTQNLGVYLVFGFLLYALISIFQDRRNYLIWILFALASIAVIFLGAWVKYNTMDIYAAYLVNPAAEWADQMNRDFSYYLKKIFFLYPVFTVIIIPWIIMNFRKRDRLGTFFLSLAFGTVLFLSLTIQKSFRYAFAITPIFAYITADFLSYNRRGMAKYLLLGIIVFQLGYAGKELMNFENYDYREVLEYVRENDRPVITDLHSFWTLYGYDIESDAVVTGPHEKWRLSKHSGTPNDRTGVDGYYQLENIDQLLSKFSEPPLIVLDAGPSRDWLDDRMERVPGYEHPGVYIGNPDTLAADGGGK